MKQTKNAKVNANRSKFIRETVFAAAIVVLPLAWWAFSFFYTTFDTIILGFKTYDRISQQTIPAGFDNFRVVISGMFTPGHLLNISLKNSIVLWLINVLFAIPLSLLVSFALYKKVIGAGIFKVILFLPSIVSSMVGVLVFSFFVDKGLCQNAELSWLSDNNINFYVLLFYNLWLGFAGNMVLYTGAMSRIPPSLVEAGHLDGMNDFQEFFHIVLPLIFPTLSVILTTCIITVFTIQLPAFAFYGNEGTQNKPHLYTFGLYSFMKGYAQDPGETPLVSAISMVVCLIAAPVSILVRKLLEKISPTVEF